MISWVGESVNDAFLCECCEGFAIRLQRLAWAREGLRRPTLTILSENPGTLWTCVGVPGPAEGELSMKLVVTQGPLKHLLAAFALAMCASLFVMTGGGVQ